MKAAISHEWLTTLGGSERVVEAFLEIYPGSPVYTSFLSSRNLPDSVMSWDIRTSFIQQLPYLHRIAQNYLPLFPLAFESFDFSSYELVLSSSTACAKGIITGPETTHICYCHTPMRYAWEPQLDTRLQFSNPLIMAGSNLLLHYLRLWDRQAADRVDHFIANSENIAAKIAKYYRRQATVINPPVNVDRFPLSSRKGSYFLVLSRLVAYKRVELAVEAFSRLGLPLKVVGDGPERQRLERMAGPCVEFSGFAGDEEVPGLIDDCIALVFPGEEDFGIVPVEAMAAGKPVIGLGRGGLLETVIDGKTGVLFPEPTVTSLIDGISRFSPADFDSAMISRHASGFSRERFKKEISKYVDARLAEAGTSGRSNTRDSRRKGGRKKR